MANMAYAPSYELEHCSRGKLNCFHLQGTGTHGYIGWLSLIQKSKIWKISERSQIWMDKKTHLDNAHLSFHDRLRIKFQGHKKYCTESLSENEKQTGNIKWSLLQTWVPSWDLLMHTCNIPQSQDIGTLKHNGPKHSGWVRLTLHQGHSQSGKGYTLRCLCKAANKVFDTGHARESGRLTSGVALNHHASTILWLSCPVDDKNKANPLPGLVLRVCGSPPGR